MIQILFFLNISHILLYTYKIKQNKTKLNLKCLERWLVQEKRHWSEMSQPESAAAVIGAQGSGLSSLFCRMCWMQLTFSELCGYLDSLLLEKGSLGADVTRTLLKQQP